MARRSEARYTTITAPAGTDYGTLNRLAAEKAKSLVGPGEIVAMAGALSVQGSPIPDQPGMEEWQVQYTVLTDAEPETPTVDKKAPVRIAIEAMTTWVEERERPGSLDALVAEHLTTQEQAHAFAVGLVSLCGWALVRAARAEGESGQATDDEIRAILQDIAQRNERD